MGKILDKVNQQIAIQKDQIEYRKDKDARWVERESGCTAQEGTGREIHGPWPQVKGRWQSAAGDALAITCAHDYETAGTTCSCSSPMLWVPSMLSCPADYAGFGQCRDWLDHITSNEQAHGMHKCTLCIHLLLESWLVPERPRRTEGQGQPEIIGHIIWQHTPVTFLALSLCCIFWWQLIYVSGS